MAEKEEPIVQVEILYGGGREGLNVVRDYVNSRIPVQVMPVSGDLTGRRTGDFLTYVTLGVKSAVDLKKSILSGRSEELGSRLIERVSLTKLGGTREPKPEALTEKERRLVKKCGLTLPENSANYF